MIKYFFTLLLASGIAFTALAQDAYLNADAAAIEKTYTGGEAYKVKTYTRKFKAEKPRNVIFMIGDGMGVAQVFAGLTANQGNLFIENCRHIGFSKTQSADNYTTDSAAGGTALACGVKTYNGAIGVDADTIPVQSILEEADAKGLATGLVSSSAITHATPASFIAHQKNRGMYEEIAADFLKTDIDVFIGGGIKHFNQRADGKNLLVDLEKKGYKVESDIEKIKTVKKGKLVGLTADVHTERVPERGNMLPVATKTAINILDNNSKKNGFFMMVEGSQIDWGGHANSTIYIVEEMLDFDKAIGEALKFAAKDGETLVVVTADHETGGMAMGNGNMNTGMVNAEYTTKGHSAIMVPVFSYGPGAEELIGIMDNTEVNAKIKKLLLGK